MDSKVAIALAVVGSLLVVSTAVVIVLLPDDEPPTPREEVDDGVYPWMDCTSECNRAISTGDNRINEHTMVGLDDDNLVAGANDYNSGLSGYAWVGTYASGDGGQTWSSEYIPGYPGDVRPSVLTGYYGTGDPVLAASSDGITYMAGIGIFRPGPASSSIWVARSFDNGVTWNPQDVFLVAEGYAVERFHDKEWIAVDPNSGIVYVSWTTFVGGAQTGHIVVSWSLDNGMTWSPYSIVSEIAVGEWQTQGSQVVVDEAGNVHVIWIDFGGKLMRHAVSYDNGLTFVDQETISDVEWTWDIPNAAYRTPTMPAVAIDRSGGPFHDQIYVSWHDVREGNADIMMIRGQTDNWTNVTRVNQDLTNNSQFFSAPMVDPHGNYHVFYYDRQYDANDSLLDLSYAVSTDGGTTFWETRVTTVSADAEDQAFLGDYIGGWATNTAAHVVYCDARVAENQGDVWTASMVIPPEGILITNPGHHNSST